HPDRLSGAASWVDTAESVTDTNDRAWSRRRPRLRRPGLCAPLAGHPHLTPRACVTPLRGAGHAVDCRHAGGHLVSRPLLMHANDPIRWSASPTSATRFWSGR